MNPSTDFTPEALKAKADNDAKVMTSLNVTYKTFVKNEKTSQGLRKKMAQEYKNLGSIENAPGMKSIYAELEQTFNQVSVTQSEYVMRYNFVFQL
jgi:hypothetical protein